MTITFTIPTTVPANNQHDAVFRAAGLCNHGLETASNVRDRRSPVPSRVRAVFVTKNQAFEIPLSEVLVPRCNILVTIFQGIDAGASVLGNTNE